MPLSRYCVWCQTTYPKGISTKYWLVLYFVTHARFYKQNFKLCYRKSKAIVTIRMAAIIFQKYLWMNLRGECPVIVLLISCSIKASKTISEWEMYVTACIPWDIYCVALPTACWQLPLEVMRYCYVVTADPMILTEPFVGSIHIHSVRNHDDVIK